MYDLRFEDFEPLPPMAGDQRPRARAAAFKARQVSLRHDADLERARRDSVQPLLRAAGIGDHDLAGEAEAETARSRRFDAEIRDALIIPPIDYRPIEETEIRLINAVHDHAAASGTLSGEHGLAWQDVDHRAEAGGFHREWQGEDEEKPSHAFDVPAGRFTARARAEGESGELSRNVSDQAIWMTFKLVPPTWGRLEIHADIWLHGFYAINSSDKWWNSRYANAWLRTFVEVHQTFTRDRDYRWLLDESVGNGAKSGRFDMRSWHFYSTEIAAHDEVEVRIGILQQTDCKGAGTFAELNFESGDGNYCWVPYVQYFMHKP